MLVHRRVPPNIKFAGTLLYTWVERSTVKVKCLAQEHNTSALGSSRKLGGASEHLIDGSEKRICRLSFEFSSPHVIERRSKFLVSEIHLQL